MTFTCTIRMDNEAFGDFPGEELARILRRLAAAMDETDASEDRGKLHDINGNTVGEYSIN